MDRGAWQATVHKVAESQRIRQDWVSKHSSDKDDLPRLPLSPFLPFSFLSDLFIPRMGQNRTMSVPGGRGQGAGGWVMMAHSRLLEAKWA